MTTKSKHIDDMRGGCQTFHRRRVDSVMLEVSIFKIMPIPNRGEGRTDI